MSRNALAMMTALALIAAPACYDADEEAELEGGLNDEMGELEAEADETMDEIETAFDDEAARFDTDVDRALDRDEWDAWWNDRELRSEWETDDQEGLSQEEFSTVAVDVLDTNDDSRVDQTEWSEASNRWLDETAATWNELDGDADGYLDENEMGEAVQNQGLFDRVDENSDGTIQDEELREWYHQILDVDGDDRIDSSEWERIKSDEGSIR